MKGKKRVPFQVYWLTSLIVSYLDDIFKECNISSEQLLVLMYIKDKGKDCGRGKLILRTEITKILKAIYGRRDSAISKIIGDMLVKRFLGEITLSSVERNQFFGISSGRHKALLLLTPGLKKIEQIDDKFDRLITQLTGDLSGLEYGPIERVLSLIDDRAILSSLSTKYN
jgi:DNA-binding MarR family transcriptional regulator